MSKLDFALLTVALIVSGVYSGRHSSKKASDTAKFHRQSLSDEPLRQRHQKTPNENVKRIELQNCTGAIGVSTLSLFPKAQKITIRDSAVETFEPTLNLTDLIVIKSKFPTIEDTFALKFSSVKNLVLLDDDNVTVNPNSLKSFRNLSTLVLSKVQLATLHVTKDWFDGPATLKQVNLAGNGIQEVAEDAFERATSVVRLDLTNNNITSLAAKVFEPLKKIKELGLYGNPLKIDLTTFEVMGDSLKVLGLPWESANQIDAKELTAKLPKLKKVSFGRENLPQNAELEDFCAKLKEAKVHCKSDNVFNVAQLL
ncbi:leucine-rich repeat-containing protein 15-like [Cylas formicarius]|uniref:leucine-rich repeat-containing protein 15-like n=1 Tax=Cylas formicarius TaxID=197179 RepID=UPI00295883AE|nr:leucine-rich repeat-containing protein 15-like [Cylas formicarius]